MCPLGQDVDVGHAVEDGPCLQQAPEFLCLWNGKTALYFLILAMGTDLLLWSKLHKKKINLDLRTDYE